MAARLLLTKRAALPLQPRRKLSRSRRISATEPSDLVRQPKATKPPKPKKPIFGTGLPVVLDQGDCLLRMRLPIRLTNGNDGRGGSFHQTARFRQQCEAQLRAWGLQRRPFSHCVEVTVIRVLGPHERLWDSSSLLRGNYKEIEDSLVALGWFYDDSPEWICITRPDQLATARSDGPAIILEIRSAD
ncbi:MAG: hypothetical protein E6Q40_08805 [Cupriavidus sp.]|nr:MAG: hypothetical protein E6Q40_08805 [Cupriavidus sp.]